MSRDPPPAKLAIVRVPSPSTPTMSPSKFPQLTPQTSTDSFDTLSPESNGGDASGHYPSTDLQNTLGRNASRRVVRRMGSRKLATYEVFVPVLRLP